MSTTIAFPETSSRRPIIKEMKLCIPTNKTINGIVIGGLTGAIGICITYPTEYVKTHLQLGNQKSSTSLQYRGSMDCIKQTVKQHGIFGFYRGLSVFLYGSIPKSAFRFGTFEFMKEKFTDDKGNLSPKMRFLCGMSAGIVEAIFAVTPMETIKVKFIHDQTLKNPKFNGFFHGIKTIIKSDGIKGIYQGLLPTIAKQGSNQAIRFFVMESLKDLYRQKHGNDAISKPIIGGMGVIAGGISVFCNTPIDVVKTRMQILEADKRQSTIQTAVQIWKNERFFGFYKGTVPRLCRVCLDVAITYIIYDSIMEARSKYCT